MTTKSDIEQNTKEDLKEQNSKSWQSYYPLGRKGTLLIFGGLTLLTVTIVAAASNNGTTSDTAPDIFNNNATDVIPPVEDPYGALTYAPTAPGTIDNSNEEEYETYIDQPTSYPTKQSPSAANGYGQNVIHVVTCPYFPGGFYIDDYLKSTPVYGERTKIQGVDAMKLAVWKYNPENMLQEADNQKPYTTWVPESWVKNNHPELFKEQNAVRRMLRQKV